LNLPISGDTSSSIRPPWRFMCSTYSLSAMPIPISSSVGGCSMRDNLRISLSRLSETDRLRHILVEFGCDAALLFVARGQQAARELSQFLFDLFVLANLLEQLLLLMFRLAVLRLGQLPFHDFGFQDLLGLLQQSDGAQPIFLVPTLGITLRRHHEVMF